MTLVGVPGIGKSRLVYELGRVVDEDDALIVWRQGRSLPYGEGVSFWALGEIVKAQAGILESDPADVTQSKLSDAAVLLADEEERAWVERHLRPLVGLGGDEVTAGDRRGEAFAAWRRFLESVAETGPTVLVFEDLHWADDGLLDFVDGLVDWVDGVPLLVVCTARPELLDRRPGWGGGKRNAVTVSLTPLDDDTTARLVLALLDRPLLDASTQQALVERAAGNPLYAEEFVRMVEAGGAVDDRLPATVQGIVSARIDLLTAEEKELVRQAAVLGKVFWSDALLALRGSEPWQVSEALRSLERKEFVRREHRSAVAGATQYAFVHALVHDAAYGQLPRAARARLHLATAEWIETLPEDRAEDRAETLAHHYLTAIDLLRAAGEDVTGIGARAVSAFQEAGERALALSAFTAASRFLGVALDLVPDGVEPSPELLLAAGQAFGMIGRDGHELALAGEAFERAGDVERAAEAAVVASWHLWHARPADARASLDRASALVEGRPASRAKALVLAERARRAMLGYQYDTAVELADTAVELARQIGDVEIEADALVTGGSARASTGQKEGITLIEGALALVGHRGRVASRGYTNLGVAQGSFGDLRQSKATFEQGLERAEREGDEQGAWFIRGNLLGGRFSQGEWDAALELVDMFVAEGEARYQEPAARAVRASILEARGDADAGAAEMEIAILRSRQNEDAQSLWPTLAAAAGIARRSGRHGESIALLDEVVDAIAASESVGDPQEWHIELVLELVAAARGDEARAISGRLPEGLWRDACQAAAEGDYLAAADVLASVGEQVLQAWLRALCARALAADGHLSEAEAQLELARAFWRRVGATAFLREADQAFAAAS